AALLSAATKQFPNEPEPYFRLGNLLAGAGQWATAERCYAATCRLQPDHAVAQHNWGVSLQETGRLQDAIGAFEHALAAKPDYATAYYSLGLAYQAAGAPEAALVAFASAMKLDGGQARFALEHARTRVNMGQFTEAIGELDRLSAACPND